MEQFKLSYFIKTKTKILEIFILLLMFFSANSFSQTLEKDTLVFGSDNNFPPYEFLDNKGNPSGFNVDLIRAISEEMGFNVKIKLGIWSNIKYEFETQKTIDIVDLFYSKEREKIVDYAVPHEINYDELYVRKGEHSITSVEHLKGKRVAAQAGSTLIEYLISNYPEIIVVPVPSEPEALIQLSEGKCDAAIVSQIIAHHALKKYNIKNVVTISRPVLPRELSFAVLKGNDQLLKQINTGLFRLKENGKLDELREKWIEKEQKSWIAENIIPIGVILIIIIILISSWILALRYTIRKRTNEIQQEIEKREKTIKALYESEEKFKILYNKSPDMFVSVSPIDARILQCNETVLQKTGYLREEVIGNPVFKMYHDDCLEEVKKVFREFGKTGEVSENELIIKTKKGDKIYVSLNVSSVRDKTGEILFSIFSLRDLSIWKKLNSEARESHEMMLNTIENMTDGFVSLDKNWIYTYVNQRAAAMFGRKPEELVGKHIWTEFPEGVGQPFYNNYHKAVETREFISFEDYYSPWDRWFENNIVPTEDGLSIFFHDVTDRKKAVQALKESEQRFVAFMNNTSAIAWIKDENLAYVFLNKAYEEKFNISLETIKGKDDLSIFDKETALQLQKNDRLVLETNQLLETEEIIRDENGHVLHYLINKFSIQVEEGKTFVCGMAIDITDRKKTEHELKKYRENLSEMVQERTKELAQSQDALLNLVDDINEQSERIEKANQKLVEINAEMETFTYSVSHDLKAPLRGIDGYSKLLIDLYKKDLNEEAQEFLNNIRGGAKQMNHLIEDLLSYSHLERQDFQIKNVALQPLINDLIVLLSGEIKKSKVQIKTSLPKDFMLLADTNGLKLVIRNLLDNAIKFSSKSEKPEIEIGSSENSTHWLIFVKDNGIGFDMKYHDRIFKIFQRLHLPEEFEGTGIGLAMVEKAMRRMNGRIWAESEMNKGTCFYLEFKK
ncbi:transporter substrate-binding domain-containing protein [Flavobacterium sp. K5-23]|uniref:PAS domain S-box protein n=1 Tax=Flavobacterium sp. K5-23 TaxID=2746225 RepID=UPI00200F1C89|nr:transporter substrate-binding domain-containing protein [Flavobacterium sp. K5-23]UQD56689.1 transporter substrate-binding domain-containing protein [Flavobacterium sp. K5-23]